MTATICTNGRDQHGRFTLGCSPGPGNPFSRRSNEIRRLFYEALNQEAAEEIVCRLVEAGRRGEKWAIIEILNRTIGKPLPGTTATVVDDEVSSALDYNRLSEDEMVTLLDLTRKALPGDK
jgi:hypothetical protein